METPNVPTPPDVAAIPVQAAPEVPPMQAAPPPPDSEPLPPDSAPEMPDSAPVLNTAGGMPIGTFGNDGASTGKNDVTGVEHLATAALNKVKFHLSTQGVHEGAFTLIKADFIKMFDALKNKL